MIRYKPRKETRRIILHDSHSAPGERFVPRDGALKMGLLDIGYHYVIERSGLIIQGRPRERIGTHTPGHNMDSIGICLVGGRGEGDGRGVNNFTDAQWGALFGLIVDLKNRYGEGLEILAHTEVQKYRKKSLPNCPPVDMDDVRQDLAMYEVERGISYANSTT